MPFKLKRLQGDHFQAQTDNGQLTWLEGQTFTEERSLFHLPLKPNQRNRLRNSREQVY